MGLVGAGNNPQVLMTVAVAIEEAGKLFAMNCPHRHDLIASQS